VEIWVAETEQSTPVVTDDPRHADLHPRDLNGFAVMWCVADQAELANLAVRPGVRGRGVGSALLDRILERCANRGAETVFLEVRRSNDAARELYRSRGFRTVGVRKRYYQEPFEDACVMMCTLES